MSLQKVTAGELSNVKALLKKAKITPELATRGQLSALGMTDRRARTLQGHLRANFAFSEGAKTTITDTGMSFSIPKTRIKSLEELVEQFKVDLSVWEVVRFVANKWEMGSLNTSKQPQTTELYQVKAEFKPKTNIVDARKEIERLKVDAKLDAKPYPALHPYRTNDGALLEIAIPDLHIGKLCWSPETGHEHYDTKIAEKTFDKALAALLSRTNSYKFSKVLFVVGNDLLHSDNEAGTTTAGTPVDVDGRYHKTFLKARRMITRAIERLQQVAPVDVLVVPGNHDQLSCWHLGDSLECIFAKNPEVHIDNSPNMRKYYQFGKVMLMFAHGNKGKLADYPLVMATEEPDMWGKTTFREAHTGDKHMLKVQELHGVRVRICSALCPPDAWHSEHMFVGNKRSAEAFIWDKEEGLVGTAVYTDPKEQQ